MKTSSEKRAEQRRYREENREKIAAEKRRYYEENREKIAAEKRRYYEENREKIAAEQRRYYEENREKIAAEQRRYYEENREKIAAEQRRYREDVLGMKPRHQWTDDQVIDAARMAGLVSPEKQILALGASNATVNSVKRIQKMRIAEYGSLESLHGMPSTFAREIVADGCPRLTLRRAAICLWVDMEQHLLPETPGFAREAIETLAKFQRWLFKSDDPRAEIERLRSAT